MSVPVISYCGCHGGGGGGGGSGVTAINYNPVNNSFSYVDESGVPQTLNIKGVVTTLSWNAGTSTLTYTNENGTVTTAVIAGGGGSTTNLSWNLATRTLSYTNSAGTVQNIVIPETVTTLTKPDAQSLQYVNEAGATTTLPLPQGFEFGTALPTTNLYDNRIFHVKYLGTYRYDTALLSWIQI